MSDESRGEALFKFWGCIGDPFRIWEAKELPRSEKKEKDKERPSRICNAREGKLKAKQLNLAQPKATRRKI